MLYFAQEFIFNSIFIINYVLLFMIKLKYAVIVSKIKNDFYKSFNKIIKLYL